MINEFINRLNKYGTMQKEDVNRLSPLVLAYLGDTVYEIYVRTMIVSNENMSVHKLHMKSIKFVSAKSQANIVRSIMGRLEDDELEIIRRGRNAKAGTMPKNVSVIDYKYATGYEALIGYLYLLKNYKRLDEIFEMSIDVVLENNNEFKKES